MWTTGSGWSIYRLDRGAATWVDTGVRSDSRGTTSSDTLWDGTHLYIASNVVTLGNSAAGQPARLYRYSYSDGTYTLDAGFPETISNNSSESLTIAQDSTGALWATWTQVAGAASTVFVNSSVPGGSDWGAPFVVPGAADPNPTPDDLSAIVAFKGDEIGIMWTDQATGTAYWATHEDGESPQNASSWQVKEAIKGNKQVDDHLNIKTLQSDATGRVYAAVKTSLNDGSSDPNLAQLVLVVFKPATGSFEQTTIARTGDCVLPTADHARYPEQPGPRVPHCTLHLGRRLPVHRSGRKHLRKNRVHGQPRLRERPRHTGHRRRQLGQHERRDQHQAERERRDRDRGHGQRPRRQALLVLGPQPRHGGPARRHCAGRVIQRQSDIGHGSSDGGLHGCLHRRYDVVGLGFR